MKHVSAVYRTHEIASRVGAEIEALGVARSDIHILPHDAAGPAADTTRDDASDRLAALGLPDDDVRAYRDAVRNGDHVVVAQVVDDEKTATIESIMRDPDHALSEDELRRRHSDDQLIAPAGAPLAAVGSTSSIGAADDGRTTYADPMESGEHVRHDGVKRD